MPNDVVKEARKVEAVDPEVDVKKVMEENKALKEQLTTAQTEYSKLVDAFNKLLKEYNELHVRSLFPQESK